MLSHVRARVSHAVFATLGVFAKQGGKGMTLAWVGLRFRLFLLDPLHGYKSI